MKLWACTFVVVNIMIMTIKRESREREREEVEKEKKKIESGKARIDWIHKQVIVLSHKEWVSEVR